MLDQSYSAENFRKIIDYENRRGVYLEGRFFPEAEEITKRIKRLNKYIKERKKFLPFEVYEKLKEKANEIKLRLKEEKETKIIAQLELVSEKIIEPNFKIILKKNLSSSSKPFYTISDTPEDYFALKQLQLNFKRLYKVKQANRYAIVSQLKVLLNDYFPSYVLRTDLEDFYESIPHDKLFQKLNEENLLTYQSKKILFQIIRDYKKLSGKDKGLPRGIGISAYLSELYMRDADSLIKSLPNVTYYARYVDDILIIFTPYSNKEVRDYLADIDNILVAKFDLQRNVSKTKPCNLIDSSTSYSINYLGYKIKFGNADIRLNLTHNKIKKYKDRIDLMINSYLNYAKLNEKKARKLLIKRIRFLTSNTRLLNNKKNILIGPYFSHNLLTNSADFDGLDRYLAHKIDTLITLPHLKLRLAKYKFKAGFELKSFSSFSTIELSAINKAWLRL